MNNGAFDPTRSLRATGFQVWMLLDAGEANLGIAK